MDFGGDCFTACFRLEMLEFDFVCENILDSGTVALQKLDAVKNGNRFCYLAHAFDENGNKSYLWITKEIAVGCVVILRRYATVMLKAGEGITLWGTNSLREKTYVPGSVRSELEKVSFLPEMQPLMELEDGS